jgi:serine/threonine protein kinase
MSFEVGNKVGAYDILERLGKGGMATVYKAYHAPLDRHVAIKVLHPAFKDDASFLRRFTREAQVVARLTHTHIVPVYDFAEHDGYPYLVMRHIEGETLKRRLAMTPMLRPDLVRIANAVAEALHYAHQQGVLHRDIKPSNILLTPDDGVYIADFGLARITQAGESTMSQDMIMGTPQYISPEQAKGHGELDRRTDVYSFGIVLYEMITGRVPFQSDTSYAIIHAQIFDDPPKPSSLNDKISPAMEEVLLKALQKNPDDRFATTLELAAAFEQAAGDMPTEIAPAVSRPLAKANPVQPTLEMESEPVSPARIMPLLPDLPDVPSADPPEEKRASKPSRKRPVLLVALGAGVGMCTCLLLIIFINNRDQRQAAARALATQTLQAVALVDTGAAPEATGASASTPPALDGAPGDLPAFPELPEEIRSVDVLEPLLKANPGNNQLRAELSMAYWRDGRRAEARSTVLEMLGQSRLPAAYVATAEKLLEAEQEDLAILVLEEGLLKFENDIRMQQTLMMALIVSGAPERQVEAYLDRLRATPRGATQITIRIGEAYLANRKGALESPPQLLNEAAADDNNPFLADMLFLEGAIYLNQEDRGQALNAFEEALQHQPSQWLTLRLEKLIDDLQ